MFDSYRDGNRVRRREIILNYQRRDSKLSSYGYLRMSSDYFVDGFTLPLSGGCRIVVPASGSIGDPQDSEKMRFSCYLEAVFL